MALFGNNPDNNNLQDPKEKRDKQTKRPNESVPQSEFAGLDFDDLNGPSQPSMPTNDPTPYYEAPTAPMTAPTEFAEGQPDFLAENTPHSVNQPAPTPTAAPFKATPDVPPVPPLNPEQNTMPYQSQPTPSATYPWKQTQQQLVNLQQQEDTLKQQLKQELLDQRSFLKHDLRRQNLNLINSQTKVGDGAQKIQSQIDEVNDGLVQWFGTKKIANHVFFNKKRTYYLLEDSLAITNDSVQKGLLGQLKQLFEGMQMALGHISANYNDQLNLVGQELRQQGLLTKNTQLINKYQDLQEYNKNLNHRPVDVPIASNMSTVHDTENRADKVYDAKQQLIMIIYYQSEKQIHVIEHYRENVVISRDIFDRNGAISATQYFDQSNNKRIIRENFYRTDGSLVLIKSYQDNEPYIQLLSRSNVLMAIFNSELELTLWWLENHVFDAETTILISVDSPLYQPLLTLENRQVEILPILDNYEANTEITDQLMQENAPIDSLLVTQSAAKTYLENNTQHDLDISVLPAGTATPDFEVESQKF